MIISAIPAPLVVNVSKILTVKGGAANIYSAPMVSVLLQLPAVVATQATAVEPMLAAAKALRAKKRNAAYANHLTPPGVMHQPRIAAVVTIATLVIKNVISVLAVRVTIMGIVILVMQRAVTV